MSTHLKNGVTTDDTGKPVFWWFNTYLRQESQRAEEFGIFIVKSVTADSSLLSPTGGVKGMYPAPHIHELRTSTWDHIANNGTDTTKHTDVYNVQF